MNTSQLLSILESNSISKVPSLFQLTLSSISKLSLWTHYQDVPESAVPCLLQKIKLSSNILIFYIIHLSFWNIFQISIWICYQIFYLHPYNS